MKEAPSVTLDDQETRLFFVFRVQQRQSVVFRSRSEIDVIV